MRKTYSESLILDVRKNKNQQKLAIIARQAMYVWRNVEARAHNYCCNGKAISITYSECVFVALRIQHAMCVHYIVICGLPHSTNCFHIIS